MSEPGVLIGRGRRADIYDLGGGRVLRRYRQGPRDVAGEAEMMTHARAHGVPVPEVFDTAGEADLVLERVDGPTMLGDLTNRPWTIRHHARELAGLHRLVHAVPGLPGLRAPFGEGPCLLHLDLHPLNVVMTANGPVIIDWENAGRGPAEADVALAWLLIRVSEVPGPLHQRLFGSIGQSSFATLFRRAAGPMDPDWFRRAAQFRLGDPTVTAREADRLRRRLSPGR